MSRHACLSSCIGRSTEIRAQYRVRRAEPRVRARTHPSGAHFSCFGSGCHQVAAIGTPRAKRGWRKATGCRLSRGPSARRRTTGETRISSPAWRLSTPREPCLVERTSYGGNTRAVTQSVGGRRRGGRQASRSRPAGLPAAREWASGEGIAMREALPPKRMLAPVYFQPPREDIFGDGVLRCKADGKRECHTWWHCGP